jgi:hypothetical protein
MTEIIETAKVPINIGKLLENQLMKWQGGGHHPRGVVEYITNSDDSYRRLQKFKGQEIIVEIHSRRGKMIDKLIIKDKAEGMSFEDLENKFFQYFESFSGREVGMKVTGRFGTGGKAYAIMNFRHCWIISVKDSKECKAWFKWDIKNKEIIKGYNNGGYKDKPTNEPNGTTVILENSYKVNIQLSDFIFYLEKLARLRHILKSQKTILRITRKNKTKEVELKYTEPDEYDALKIYRFSLPKHLKGADDNSELILRYFEKPLGENSFIDLSDGISSVADLEVSKFDGRPFSKYINGALTITKLVDSVAVKENRRGLEEDDDLTNEIEDFIRPKVSDVITEVENIQRQLDKERRIDAANKKLQELSKFLSKQDLKFKLELNELKKRFSQVDNFPTANNEDDKNEKIDVYRKPLPDDPEELLIRGKWITVRGTSDNEGPQRKIYEFIPEQNGEDIAIKVGVRKRVLSQKKKKKQGLQVLMSNDPDNHESPQFGQYDDPVSDRDMVSKGIIWINAVHPIIVKYGEKKENDVIVLMIVSQYYAQKEYELQPVDERDDVLLLFRKHFFILQIEIREDTDISYFDNKKEN